MGRSEKLIEYGDSWFSPKRIQVRPRGKKVAEVELWMDEGGCGPTDFNQTANAATGSSGARPCGRSFTVERETAQIAS